MVSVLRLLDKQHLDKITVQEIITECRISRNTFYCHFGDIYALLDTLLQDGAGKLKERHQAGISWDENPRQVIAYILQNRRRANHIYRSLDLGLLEQHLRQAAEDLFSEYIQDAVQDPQVSREDIQTIVYLYQSAFAGAAADWTRWGMKLGVVDVGGGLRGVYAAGIFDFCLTEEYGSMLV